MNLIDKVKNSLIWKRSTYYCAAKLGISVVKYKELKIKLPEFPKKKWFGNLN